MTADHIYNITFWWLIKMPLMIWSAGSFTRPDTPSKCCAFLRFHLYKAQNYWLGRVGAIYRGGWLVLWWASSTTNEINRRCILYATPMMAEEHLFVVPLLPLRAHTHRTNCIDFVSWSWHDAHKIMSVLFLTGSELSFSYLVVWQRSCYGFFKAYYYLYNLCICQIRKNIGWIFCSFYWLH